MSATEFFRKHTTGSTPIVVAGIVFVGVPVLTTLDTAMENLANRGTTSAYDWTRAITKAGIVGLSALGGFMSTTYDKWRKEKEKHKA